MLGTWVGRAVRIVQGSRPLHPIATADTQQLQYLHGRHQRPFTDRHRPFRHPLVSINCGAVGNTHADVARSGPSQDGHICSEQRVANLQSFYLSTVFVRAGEELLRQSKIDQRAI